MRVAYVVPLWRTWYVSDVNRCAGSFLANILEMLHGEEIARYKGYAKLQ